MAKMNIPLKTEESTGRYKKAMNESPPFSQEEEIRRYRIANNQQPTDTTAQQAKAFADFIKKN